MCINDSSATQLPRSRHTNNSAAFDKKLFDVVDYSASAPALFVILVDPESGALSLFKSNNVKVEVYADERGKLYVVVEMNRVHTSCNILVFQANIEIARPRSSQVSDSLHTPPTCSRADNAM